MKYGGGSLAEKRSTEAAVPGSNIIRLNIEKPKRHAGSLFSHSKNAVSARKDSFFAIVQLTIRLFKKLVQHFLIFGVNLLYGMYAYVSSFV